MKKKTQTHRRTVSRHDESVPPLCLRWAESGFTADSAETDSSHNHSKTAGRHSVQQDVTSFTLTDGCFLSAADRKYNLSPSVRLRPPCCSACVMWTRPSSRDTHNQRDSADHETLDGVSGFKPPAALRRRPQESPCRHHTTHSCPTMQCTQEVEEKVE